MSLEGVLWDLFKGMSLGKVSCGKVLRGRSLGMSLVMSSGCVPRVPLWLSLEGVLGNVCGLWGFLWGCFCGLWTFVEGRLCGCLGRCVRGMLPRCFEGMSLGDVIAGVFGNVFAFVLVDVLGGDFGGVSKRCLVGMVLRFLGSCLSGMSWGMSFNSLGLWGGVFRACLWGGCLLGLSVRLEGCLRKSWLGIALVDCFLEAVIELSLEGWLLEDVVGYFSLDHVFQHILWGCLPQCFSEQLGDVVEMSWGSLWGSVGALVGISSDSWTCVWECLREGSFVDPWRAKQSNLFSHVANIFWSLESL